MTWRRRSTYARQLERHGLSVFRDDESIRAGDLWLDRLQEAVDGCGGFVVLVGRDGVARWVGAETQVALNRYFGPHDDAQRLPIFPVLLGGATPESLPAFLRLFQATPWNGVDALPSACSSRSAARAIVANDKVAFEGCPFVGLAPTGSIRRSCSSAGRRRPSTRWPASTRGRAPRRSAGSRSTATAARASPR